MKNFQKNKPVFPDKCRNRKGINLASVRKKSLLFWTLLIEKPRRLNFVSFSGLEKSETKLRNERKLSETKLSGDSLFKRHM